MSENYTRNGFSLLCIPVKTFNRMVELGTLKERKMTSPLYLFKTNKGKNRKTGFVAFTYDSAFFGKTQKEALESYKKYH